MKQTIIMTMWMRRPIVLVAVFLLTLLAVPALSVGVASAVDCPKGYTKVESGATAKDREPVCLPSTRGFEVTQDCARGKCLFEKYINKIINAVAICVGVVCTGSYVYAGIQYGSSANNSQKVSEAKQRIVTTTFVLVGFFMLYAFLDWIIPGGLVSIQDPGAV